MESTIKFILINIGYAEHHADWNYQQVVSPFTRIYLPVAGRAKVHMPNGSYDVEPGYLYIIPAYCMHHYQCDSDFSLYYIHLYEEEDNHLTIGENYNFEHKIPATEIDNVVVKHLLACNPDKSLRSYNPQFYDNHTTFIGDISISTHDAPHLQMETESILRLLISHFVKYAKPKNEKLDDRIAKTLLYIRSNLANPIEVADLAKLSCVSVEYFTRKFTSQIGESPIKYIQTKRMQRAQLLLMVNTTHIKDVAYAVGFNDVSYFNRVFKKTVGCTPQEYRRQIQIQPTDSNEITAIEI
ncbi:MAG: AraC family transcriptional regulator [Rikenellaceae bacterium]